MKITRKTVDDIILGSALGDGSIEKPSGKNIRPTMSFHHSREKEFDYIRFKHEVISKYYRTNNVRTGNNNTERFSISSLEEEIISRVQALTRYPDNTRKLPSAEYMTPLSLLIWYLDDGSFPICIQKRKYKNSIHRKLKITLKSYRDEDILQFLDEINPKFKLNLRAYRENGKINDIGISNNIKEIAKFLEVIYPYKDLIPDQMHYKFCLGYHSTQILNDPKLKKYNVCDFHETYTCTCRNKSFAELL